MGPQQPGGISRALLLAMLTALGTAALVAIGGMPNPTTTTGDTIYRGADGGIQRLGIGADASVLTSINGVPTWAAASGGGLPSGTGFVTVSGGVGGVLTAESTSAAGLLDALGSTVPTSGALHHWRLSGSGPWSDLGSGASTLTATGASWQTDRPGVSIWRGGVVSVSPATGDRLSASTSIASGSDLTIAITVGARTVGDASAWGVVRALVFAWDGNTVTRNYFCVLTTAGNVYVATAVANTVVDTGSVVLDWTIPHRVTATHVQSTGAITLYVDGYSRVTATNTGTRAAITRIDVGGTPGNAFGVPTGLAVMSELLVRNTALTAAQVLTDWEDARKAMGR